jgi:hypothetical protein
VKPIRVRVPPRVAEHRDDLAVLAGAVQVLGQHRDICSSRHPGCFRRLDVPHRVADHHARCVRRRTQLLQRHLQQVRGRLERLDVGAARPVVGDAAGVQLVQEDIHVALLTRAGQHEPVTTFPDGDERVTGTGQRRHLLQQRVDSLPCCSRA